MVDVTHLSYSSIQTFLTCSENWRRKYIAKEPVMSTPALVFGSAIHQTIETQILNRHEMIDTDALTTFSGVWASKVESEPNCDWGADTPEEYYNDGIRILSSPDVKRLIDSVRPMVDDEGPFIERKIELQVPGVPIPIVGYIDIMTSDGVPGDFKTSSRAWDSDKAHNELQPLFYLAALNQIGIDVPGLRFRHYVITKTKKPQVQVLETSRKWDEVFWLLDMIGNVWAAIESESFVPNPGAWLCSAKYCSFYQKCRGKGL